MNGNRNCWIISNRQKGNKLDMYYIKKIAYFLLRIKFMLFNKRLKLKTGSRISPISKFEGFNKIGEFAFFKGEIGKYSYVGEHSIVVGKIGKYTSIAANVVFLTKTHPTSCFVSTSPVFYSLKKQVGFTFAKKQYFNEEPSYHDDSCSIIVGNDVYIGYGATIIGPVKIGDGSIICSNAVVTKDVEPYSIVGGVPAKTIRKRFDDNQIEFLMNDKWWDKDEKWINNNSDLFISINDYIHIVEKEF